MNSTATAIAESAAVEIITELNERPTTAEDIQLWSAMTLRSLQKQLTGHENDPRFSRAKALIDGLARQFATADPINIADYFEAVEALASVKSNSYARLDAIADLDPAA